MVLLVWSLVLSSFGGDFVEAQFEQFVFRNFSVENIINFTQTAPATQGENSSHCIGFFPSIVIIIIIFLITVLIVLLYISMNICSHNLHANNRIIVGIQVICFIVIYFCFYVIWI